MSHGWTMTQGLTPDARGTAGITINGRVVVTEGIQHWGIQPDTVADEQFKMDLAEIREAELTAERDAHHLHIR